MTTKFIHLLLGVLLQIHSLQAQEANEEREILIYEYHSEVVKDIQNAILDTLKARFQCESLDLVGLELKDSLGEIHFSVSTKRGIIYSLFDSDEYKRDSISRGFILENSTTLFLFYGDDLDILKRIGAIHFVERKPFVPHVKDLNNVCLNEQNEIYTSIIVDFTGWINKENELQFNPPWFWYVGKRSSEKKTFFRWFKKDG